MPPTLYILLLIKEIKSIALFINLHRNLEHKWLTFPFLFDIRREKSSTQGIIKETYYHYGDEEYNIKTIIQNESSEEIIENLQDLQQISFPQGTRLRAILEY